MVCGGENGDCIYWRVCGVVSKQVHMPVSRDILYRILGPFIFTTIVFVIFYSTMRKHLPHSASGEEWIQFVNFVFVDLKHMPWYKVFSMVFFIQIGHTVLAIPCIHLSQMLFGYCFGVLYAGSISAVCECMIVSVFVLSYAVHNQFSDASFDEFVCDIRKKNQLYVFIFLSQMSSVPINSTSCIIGFGNVSAREYLSIHYFVSTANAFKCTIIGHQIHIATQQHTIILLGYIIGFISLFPTFITMGLTYFTFLNYKNQGLTQDFEFPTKCEQEIVEISPADIRLIADDSVSQVDKEATESTNSQDDNPADFSCKIMRTIISKTPFCSKHQYDQIEEDLSNMEEHPAESQDALLSGSEMRLVESEDALLHETDCQPIDNSSQDQRKGPKN